MQIKPKIIAIIGAQPDIGKGIFAASCAYLIQKTGSRVIPLKFDGYLNYSSGTMNPYHRTDNTSYFNEEVFVLGDGLETDVDSGYYERFLNKSFDSKTVLTNGVIMQQIIEEENGKDYLSGTVLKFSDMRRHITDWIMNATKKAEVVVLEIGGTIGDGESALVYESLSLLKETNKADVFVIMMAPYYSVRDKKNKDYDFSLGSKIIRQSFLAAWDRNLRPNSIVLRNKGNYINELDLEYIFSDCSVTKDDVFADPDVSSIYELPLKLKQQGFDKYIYNKLGLPREASNPPNILEEYVCGLKKINNSKKAPIKVGIFGKTPSFDSFVSLIEAIDHASVEVGNSTQIIWLDDDKDWKSTVKTIDVLIIGEGLAFQKEKVEAIKYTRKNNIPTLAISFGFDLGVSEILDNKLLSNKAVAKGNIKINLKKDTLASKIYKKKNIIERNRHDSYLTDKAVDSLEKNNIVVSGVGSDGHVAILEDPAHPFYLLVKFHPEFISRPGGAHLIFVNLLKTAINK